MTNTLHLTLKKKWFDMIAAGKKKEEYRELKKHWADRLLVKALVWPDTAKKHAVNAWATIAAGDHKCHEWIEDTGCKSPYIAFNTVTFRNGYSANAPTMVVECLGIAIGTAKPEWSDNWKGDVFIIKLGKVLSITNH